MKTILRNSQILLALLVASTAFALNPNPVAHYGKVDLAAATATMIPSSPLSSRNGIAIQNKDTASFFCAFDNLVTDQNGWEILPGERYSISAQFVVAKSSIQVWCYSILGTSGANNNLRWQEL